MKQEIGEPISAPQETSVSRVEQHTCEGCGRLVSNRLKMIKVVKAYTNLDKDVFLNLCRKCRTAYRKEREKERS